MYKILPDLIPMKLMEKISALYGYPIYKIIKRVGHYYCETRNPSITYRPNKKHKITLKLLKIDVLETFLYVNCKDREYYEYIES